MGEDGSLKNPGVDLDLIRAGFSEDFFMYLNNLQRALASLAPSPLREVEYLVYPDRQNPHYVINRWFDNWNRIRFRASLNKKIYRIEVGDNTSRFYICAIRYLQDFVSNLVDDKLKAVIFGPSPKDAKEISLDVLILRDFMGVKEEEFFKFPFYQRMVEKNPLERYHIKLVGHDESLFLFVPHTRDPSVRGRLCDLFYICYTGGAQEVERATMLLSELIAKYPFNDPGLRNPIVDRSIR